MPDRRPRRFSDAHISPVIVELIVSDNNAAEWSKLAARDWTGYIAARAR